MVPASKSEKLGGFVFPIRTDFYFLFLMAPTDMMRLMMQNTRTRKMSMESRVMASPPDILKIPLSKMSLTLKGSLLHQQNFWLWYTFFKLP